MKYFETPVQLDGKRILINAKKGVYHEFVGGELFTEKECKNMGLNTSVLIPVQISPKRVYFSFGIRFSL